MSFIRFKSYHSGLDKMNTESELIEYLLRNGNKLLYDTVGDQRLIGYDKKMN